MAELADARDLKSLVLQGVRVRVPPRLDYRPSYQYILEMLTLTLGTHWPRTILFLSKRMVWLPTRIFVSGLALQREPLKLHASGT